MRDEERSRLATALEELCHAVGADGGGALYIDDGEGVLQLAASAGHGIGRAPGILDKLRGGGASPEKDGRSLILTVPGPRAGFVVMARKDRNDFTQQDRTLAGLYMRRLADNGATVLGNMSGGTWTRQLEAIQRIAARLTRLASIEDVGATICSETRQVVEYTEAQVLV
ncbi:MAG: hypothetical protein ABIP53_03690, partial [Candidatus Limnocylindrales bacterium]